ncbi:hypothetical protein [Methylobacterium durans]|uniref:hypothetical protein n=1 Tax=Methylobacterium durans TaxID=2202825 RepID=UPI0013A5AF13|nr:hypothetical protein [Methylobacterium durans]
MRAGIDAPERLLFMKVTEIGALKGIGRAELDEVYAYRARFDPSSADKPQL